MGTTISRCTSVDLFYIDTHTHKMRQLTIIAVTVNCCVLWCCCFVSSTARAVSKSSTSYHHRNIKPEPPYRLRSDQNASATAFDSVAINPKNDAEIVLSPPNDQSHHHLDKHMERLVTTTAFDTSYAPERTTDPLLYDYSAYLGQPFVFDYTKALNEAVQHAKHDVIESNYNLDESVFADERDSSSTDPPVTMQLFTAAEPLKPSSLQQELFGVGDNGQAPRSEKLTRRPPMMFPTASAGTLPIGLAFFQALREQNNRPYSEAFAVPARTFAALYATTTMATPSVTPKTVALADDSFYQVRETPETVENHTADYSPEYEINTSHNHSSEQFVRPDDESGLSQMNMESNRANQQQTYDNTPNHENYEIRVIRTYSSKPASKHISREKLLHENKIATEKPRAFERKKKAYVPRKKLNSQTTPAPSLISNERRRQPKQSRYVFDNEYYHPDAGRELHIIVPEAEQPTQIFTRVRRQLESPGGPLVFDWYRPQQYQLFKDDVELIDKMPKQSRNPAPASRPKPKKPKSRRNKPNNMKDSTGSTATPPVELRYFQ